MGKQLYKQFFLCGLIVLLLSGCWDALNIEERNFAVGTAIDLTKGKQGKYPIIELTNQFVIPIAFGAPDQGSGDEKAYKNVTVKGDSVAMIQQDMGTMTSRLPFYGHLKILIFSEEVAKNKNLIASLSDSFIRAPEMRRGIKVFIAEGKAKDILDLKQEQERLPSTYIEMIMENNNKSLETIDALRIGELQSYLLAESSYVLPKLSLVDGELHSEEAAVFHGPTNKLIGTLNEQEIKGYNLVTKKNNIGTIKMNVDDHLMVLEVDKTKSKLTVNVDNPSQVDVSIHIDADGFITEMFGSRKLLKDDYLEKIGKKAADKMKKLIHETIKKSQEELHTDILGVRKTIKHKHYKVWKEIKDDWEIGKKYFDNATFHVTVDARVKNTGAMDQVKTRGK